MHRFYHNHIGVYNIGVAFLVVTAFQFGIAAPLFEKRHINVNHQTFPWLSFGILTGIGGIAMFLAMPRPLRLISFILSVIVLGILVGMGLLLSKSTGLKTLVINDVSVGSHLQPLMQILGRATLIGAGLGTVILLAIRFLLVFILSEIRLRFAAEAGLETWRRVVIAFDSAVLEEITFRLFLFSSLVWIVSKIWRIQELPNPEILWAINVLIAIGFGMTHLPQWSEITPLTPLVIVSVVFLNSVGGLTFGYLNFAYGLEAAIVAHFAADIALHVIGPGLLQA